MNGANKHYSLVAEHCIDSCNDDVCERDVPQNTHLEQLSSVFENKYFTFFFGFQKHDFLRFF